ncbi:hypothetical protein KC354_g17506 [Hortaea werneckii]|nr:hypothetical protein KC354_g17506 [Hortaea werneckii]
MRLSTSILANLTLLSGAALAQMTTTTTGKCTTGCTAQSTPMPTMNNSTTAAPYPAGNGTTIHISNCPSAYYSTGGMMTPTTPASGPETTTVACDGTCPDTSAGMPTDSGMETPGASSSGAGPSMGMEGGYSNAGGSSRGEIWMGGVVGVLVGLSWV